MPAKVEFSQQEKDQIVALYQQHRSMRRVGALINRDRHLVQKVLWERGVPLQGPDYTKLPVHPEVFDSLTPESAYFLGLFITDGWIDAEGYVGFGLKHSDAYMVERFRDFVAPQHKVIQDRHMSKVSILDRHLALAIVQWGLPRRDKTHRLGACRDLFTAADEASCTSALVRGLLDGNGCIYTKNPYNASISFLGTGPFIQELHRHIPTAHTGSIHQDKRSSCLWELRYTGQKVLCEIGAWLYADKDDLYLKRKWELYNDVVKSRELRGTPNGTIRSQAEGSQ